MPSPEERASICLTMALIEALEANGTLAEGEGAEVIKTGARIARAYGDDDAANLLADKIAPVLERLVVSHEGASLRA